MSNYYGAANAMDMTGAPEFAHGRQPEIMPPAPMQPMEAVQPLAHVRQLPQVDPMRAMHPVYPMQPMEHVPHVNTLPNNLVNSNPLESMESNPIIKDNLGEQSVAYSMGGTLNGEVQDYRAIEIETEYNPDASSFIAPDDSTSSANKRIFKRGFQLTSSRKIAPLKKKDGEALWRKDIQYDFLNAVFTDENKVFTNRHNNNEPDTFAKVYLDAMAHSSKCSKVLGERLTGDRKTGIKIAMVCLLVNLGRINTTLNFFPEMKGALRTYHPIPSLQTQDAQDYKQLQDAPRLKSILKGACDVSHDLTHVDSLPPPKTVTPIHLIFLMTASPHLVEASFNGSNSASNEQIRFFDLIMDTKKSSKSRAKAFLWLMYEHLERTPSIPNPFGSQFPAPIPIQSGDAGIENVDTPWEIAFGTKKSLQRLSILEPSNTSLVVNNPPSDKTFAPLVIPKRKMRSAKDRRSQEFYQQLLKEKRHKRYLKRQELDNPIYAQWLKMQDIDPIYETDEELDKLKQKQRTIEFPAGALAVGIGSKYNDYGERASSYSLVLKRVSKTVRDE